MITFQEQLDQVSKAEDAILSMLDREDRASVLIEEAHKMGFNYDIVRTAVWFLISDYRVRLTDDKKLMRVI